MENPALTETTYYIPLSMGRGEIHPFSHRAFRAPYRVPAASRTLPPESCWVSCMMP